MEPTYPTDFQKKILWRALTGVGVFTIGFLLVSLIWLGSQVLGYLQPVLIPIAVSGIVAYLLDPFVSWLQRKGLSRLKSVIAVFSSFIIAIVIMGLIILPPIVTKARDTFDTKPENVEGQLVVRTLQKQSMNSEKLLG